MAQGETHAATDTKSDAKRDNKDKDSKLQATAQHQHRRFTLIIDKSGSMEGDNWKQALDATTQIVRAAARYSPQVCSYFRSLQSPSPGTPAVTDCSSFDYCLAGCDAHFLQ